MYFWTYLLLLNFYNTIPRTPFSSCSASSTNPRLNQMEYFQSMRLHLTRIISWYVSHVWKSNLKSSSFFFLLFLSNHILFLVTCTGGCCKKTASTRTESWTAMKRTNMKKKIKWKSVICQSSAALNDMKNLHQSPLTQKRCLVALLHWTPSFKSETEKNSLRKKKRKKIKTMRKYFDPDRRFEKVFDPLWRLFL